MLSTGLENCGKFETSNSVSEIIVNGTDMPDVKLTDYIL